MKIDTFSIIAALLIASSGILKAQEPAAANGSAVVAEINGSTVTLGELEQKRADNLYQARRTYYEAERKALEDLIDERLLEMQARKENVTVDQLLDRHVNSQVKDPTNDELRVIYEILKTDQPFEVARGQIVTQLREVRISRARAEYIKTLRSQAKVSVSLAEPRVQIALNGKELRGSPNAPVRVVEFADYQCPYCRQLEPQLERLQSEFGDKVAMAFLDFPLPMHAHAEKLAEAADCAGAQGKFWDYHDFLFKELKDPFDVAVLKNQARALNLDPAKFDSCLDSGSPAAAIKKEKAEGVQLGVSATPTLFVNGRLVSSPVKYEALREMVQEELSGASSRTGESAQR